MRIHWRPQPYREKWVIGRAGTAAAPIVVRGVLGPGGERPVVSGDGATTPDPLDYTGEQRGVIKIGTSNVPPDTLPAYIVIENLDVRSAHPSYSFTDDHGAAQTYANNAAAIYVERAQHLVIRNCVLSDSGNGLFIGAFDGDTQDVLIEGNWIHGNGNAGSVFEHNAYTAAIGIVYQANRFGPLRAGAGGNNLKDRSAGLVVRYNWIEGGNRQLDLVDAEDSDVLVNHPSYRETFVYGNVLIEPDGAGNSQIVHYGGDSGATAIYRKGILHFFHNTVVSLRSGNTTLLRLSTDDESADARNNLLYVAAAGNRLAMLDADGVLALSHNWTKPGWVGSHGGLSGVIDDDGTGVEGTAPGFVDAATQNFHLLETSDAVDAGHRPASGRVAGPRCRLAVPGAPDARAAPGRRRARPRRLRAAGAWPGRGFGVRLRHTRRIEEETMGFIVWLIVGGIVGWLASIIMKTNEQQGIMLNVAVGIAGAFLAGLVGAPFDQRGDHHREHPGVDRRRGRAARADQPDPPRPRPVGAIPPCVFFAPVRPGNALQFCPRTGTADARLRASRFGQSRVAAG